MQQVIILFGVRVGVDDDRDTQFFGTTGVDIIEICAFAVRDLSSCCSADDMHIPVVNGVDHVLGHFESSDVLHWAQGAVRC